MISYVAHESNGVYGKDIKVFVNRRLKYMPYAQAGWCDLQSGEIVAMYSYSSMIFTAWLHPVKGLMYINVTHADAAINYSRTTSRQVTAAMQELGLSSSEIAALKRFFTRGGNFAVISSDNKQWLDVDTGKVICEVV